MTNKSVVSTKQLIEYISKMPSEKPIELRSMFNPNSYVLELHVIFPMELVGENKL